MTCFYVCYIFCVCVVVFLQSAASLTARKEGVRQMADVFHASLFALDEVGIFCFVFHQFFDTIEIPALLIHSCICVCVCVCVCVCMCVWCVCMCVCEWVCVCVYMSVLVCLHMCMWLNQAIIEVRIPVMTVGQSWRKFEEFSLVMDRNGFWLPTAAVKASLFFSNGCVLSAQLHVFCFYKHAVSQQLCCLHNCSISATVFFLCSCVFCLHTAVFIFHNCVQSPQLWSLSITVFYVNNHIQSPQLCSVSTTVFSLHNSGLCP